MIKALRVRKGMEEKPQLECCPEGQLKVARSVPQHVYMEGHCPPVKKWDA